MAEIQYVNPVVDVVELAGVRVEEEEVELEAGGEVVVVPRLVVVSGISAVEWQP